MATSHTEFLPSETLEAALDRAAALWGILPEYWDIFGRHHPTPPAVKQAILRSMGVPADTREGIDQAIEGRMWRCWSRPLPPTLVMGESDRPEMEVRLPEGSDHHELRLEVDWENGETSALTLTPRDLPERGTAELRGRRFVCRRAALPAPLRLGYHRLRVSCGLSQETCCCDLIIGPDRAWSPPAYSAGHGRGAGVTVSLYGVRSRRNWGCGDTTDLKALADWVAGEVRGAFLGLNPLHAIQNRAPYNTSPYLPNCTFYRNFIYIDPECVEELERSPRARRLVESAGFQQRLCVLREAEFVEYEQVARLKLRFLKLLFRTFLRDWQSGAGRAAEFRAWRDAEGDLLDRFAVYCALDEVLHKQDRNAWLWIEWPEPYRDPESAAVREFAAKHWRLVLFYQWMQWVLDRQFAEAQQYAVEAGLPVGLYHDLALATDRFGSDLWAHRRFYVHGCRVGSPPDDFSPDGQDWSFPPPDARQHHEDGYRHFIASIRHSCRHGGALRIDHVMRFFRLFGIPEGLPASHGAYVRDNPEELLRILALESVRQKVVIVGEDLGTVEPSFREALAKFGMLSYRLLYFEKHADGRFRLPHEYPRQALVSVTTHDLPTLAGFWMGRDVEARRAAGVIDDNAYRSQKEDRVREKQQLLDTLLSLKLLPETYPRSAAELPELTGDLHHAVVGFLAMTPSMLLALNQEDLTKETEQQNLPGTTAQYPNWRRKMRFLVEELGTSKAALDCAAMFRHWLGKTGRLNSRH